MALHKDGDIVATGQMAATGKAKLLDIYIWKSSDQEVLAKLSGFHRRAIRTLEFSPNGKFLLSIGEDDNHSVALYDWAA